MRIAVTGATGYIGGRLVPRLLAEGHDVVCPVRNPAKLEGRSWSGSVEAIAADVGLGYRIFLVRRYLSMDIILPYVAWITLLAYLLDRILHLTSRRLFRWAYLQGESL